MLCSTFYYLEADSVSIETVAPGNGIGKQIIISVQLLLVAFSKMLEKESSSGKTWLVLKQKCKE